MKKRTIAFIFFIFLGILITAGCTSIKPDIVSQWELASYGDVTNVTLAMPDVDTFIKFGIGGKFNGNVGCNSFGGNYHLIGDRIFFNSIYSTEMYCEETWNQEQGVLSLLSKPDLRVQLNNETLTVTNGTYVVNLIKKII